MKKVLSLFLSVLPLMAQYSTINGNQGQTVSAPSVVNDVTQMGVVANNATTDNTAALNAVFSKACTNHLPVYFPANVNYYGTKPLNTISGCSITIMGDGPNKSIVRAIGTGTNNSLLNFSNTSIQNSLTIKDITFDGTNSGTGNTPNFEMAGVSVNGYNSLIVSNAVFSNFGTPGYSSTNGGNHTNSYDGLYAINGETMTIGNSVANNNERAGIETQAIHYLYALNLGLSKNGEFGIVAEQNFASVSGVNGTTDGPLFVQYNNIICSNNGGGCSDVETADTLPVVTAAINNINANNDGYDPWGTAYNVGAEATNAFEWDIALGHRSQGTVANSQSTNFATSGTYTAPGQRDGILVSSASGPTTLRNNTVINAGDDGILVNEANNNVLTITGNVLNSNKKDGLYTYDQADGSNISGNTMANNTSYGIEINLGRGTAIIGNQLPGNTAGALSVTSTYGSVVQNYIGTISTPSITPTAVAAQTCSDQTATVTGLNTTDSLGALTPPAALGNISATAYVSAANTLLLHFCNPTAASVTPPAGVYKFANLK